MLRRRILYQPQAETRLSSNQKKLQRKKIQNKEISLPSNSNIEAGKKSINLEAISHSLKSMLKPEQANSLDLIMKMAQLLAQDSAYRKGKCRLNYINRHFLKNYDVSAVLTVTPFRLPNFPVKAPISICIAFYDNGYYRNSSPYRGYPFSLL